MRTKNTINTKIDMSMVLRLAAAALVDPRTAERALREGVSAIRGRLVRERLAAAIAALKAAA